MPLWLTVLPAQDVSPLPRPYDRVQSLQLPQTRVEDSGHGDPLSGRPERQEARRQVPAASDRAGLHDQPDPALGALDRQEGLVFGQALPQGRPRGSQPVGLEGAVARHALVGGEEEGVVVEAEAGGQAAAEEAVVQARVGRLPHKRGHGGPRLEQVGVIAHLSQLHQHIDH